MPPKKLLIKDPSTRFAEIINEYTPVNTTKSLPKRINLIQDMTPFIKGLEGLWALKITDTSLCGEWIKTIYEIFGYTKTISGAATPEQYQKKDINTQIDILEKYYKQFVNFTLRLQNLLVFMTAEMPDQKETLINTLTSHFRNHCFNNTLDYNQAANVCDSLALFYVTTNRTTTLQQRLQKLHPTITGMDHADKLSLTLAILDKLQKNPPEAGATISNAHKYTAIQTRLLECILLRLRVIGIETGGGGAAQGPIENKIPDEIKLFLGQLPKFRDSRTCTTISLWLSHYNPTTESIATYLKRKAKTPEESTLRTTPETTSELFAQLEQTIITNKLNDKTQEQTSTAEKTEREEAYSPLRTLSNMYERAEPRAHGGASAATASTTSADTGGIELRTLTQQATNPTVQEQYEVLEYTQWCRIIQPSEIINAYKNLEPDQAILFLKAFMRLQGIEALEGTDLKAAYQPATAHKNKKSLYHPQLNVILTAWKTHARTMMNLQPLLLAQKEAWTADGSRRDADANTQFENLAELVVDHLILPEELVAYGILSREQYDTYRRLLSFNRLTPGSINGRLVDETPLLLQNDIACLRANPKLWEDMLGIITHLAGPGNLPLATGLREKFRDDHDNNHVFSGKVTMGEDLIHGTTNTAFSTGGEIVAQVLQIKRQLPPPGFVLDELFKKLNIDETIVLDLDKLGETLEETLRAYLIDTFPEINDRIKVIRAYIEYLIAHPDFTYTEWTRPERVEHRRATANELDQSAAADATSQKEPEQDNADEAASDEDTADLREIPGLKLAEIPGDDHCLYHAVAVHVGKTKDKLRQEVATYMTEHIEHYRPAIEGDNPGTNAEDYIARVTGNEWAGNAEIAVLMIVLEKPIIIIGPEGIRRGLEQSQLTEDPIFIAYNGTNHYDTYLLTGTHTHHEILASLLTPTEQDELPTQQDNQSIVSANTREPDTVVNMPRSMPTSFIRPGTEAEYPDDVNAQKRIKSGIEKLLRHFVNALDAYATKASSRGKCINHTVTAIYLLLFLGASAATAEFYLRLQNDPSGMKMTEREFEIVNFSGYLSNTIFGGLVMKLPYMLTPKRLERIDIQEMLSELKEERSPNRTKALIANAIAALLMLAAIAGQVCIKHYILDPADRESNRSDDDSPGAQIIDKWGPIGNDFVMGAFFMAGVLAVISLHTTIIGCKHRWGGCGKTGVRAIPEEDGSDDEDTPNLHQPATRRGSGADTPLLGRKTGTSYGTITTHPSGIVRTTTPLREHNATMARRTDTEVLLETIS